MGWLVAEWLKHSTANRKVAGSNPTIAIGDFLSRGTWVHRLCLLQALISHHSGKPLKGSHQASCDQCRARTLEYCWRSCRRTTLVKIFVEIISRMTCNSRNSRKFRPAKFKRYTVLSIVSLSPSVKTIILMILAFGLAVIATGNHPSLVC